MSILENKEWEKEFQWSKDTKTDIDKKIEKTAEDYADHQIEYNEAEPYDYSEMVEAVIFGVKSDVAKEYHTKGMCSEREMHLNMQYYMEHLERTGEYITPQNWIKHHKHF